MHLFYGIHMKKNLYLLSVLFGISIASLAQRPNSFSFDPNVFINEFEDYMRSGNRDVKDAAEDFAANYNAGKVAQPQKIQIIKLCNEMLQANAQLSPDFLYYMKTINAFVTTGQMSKFDSWHKTLSGAIKRSKDEFQRFLTVSKNVFADGVILKVGSFTWVTTSTDIQLQIQGQAMFIFKNMNLICYTPGDTFEIYNTSGKFFSGTAQWQGSGGKIDWTRVGLDSTKVFALLKNYRIDLMEGTMIADSATFYNKFRFDKPLMGRVTDKPQSQSQGDKSIYPQFESAGDVFSGISYGKAKYKGGFGMRGAVVLGKSLGKQKSELYFYYKNKPVLRVAADEFFVRENKITNEKVELTVFLDKDSVFHPQLHFTYFVKEDRIYLYRDNKMGISAAPFGDYYHNLEFYVDEVNWDLNNPKIDLKMIAADDPARFQSINYFRDLIYERLEGMLDYNPLERIKMYCEKYKTNTFNIKTYAALYKSNISDIKLQMISLNDKGFLNYNTRDETVTIKTKLKEYVNAHYGRVDYDAISIRSVISALPNASISLINNDLIIQGVPKFYFSDSQNVYIVPKDQVINIKKNRNMNFSGKIRAGMADFYGSNFAFDYTRFDVRLNNVDSLKFLYRDDTLGYLANVKSVIQNIYGTLEIDYPYNKSSRKRYPGFPKFTSEVGSKVYYDYPSTQKGSYTKERFYFAVDPFKLDSLSDLNLYTLALAGTFVSDGILPDMPQAISMQPDKSLGFFIPNDTTYSYTLYKGKGSSKMSVSLSNEGLIGNGRVYYLASKSESNRFVFLLDSMNADCQMFENDRTSKFPTVIKSANVYNHWIPYQDTMFIMNKGEPIKIAYERALLRGTIILTPDAMKAKGRMDIEDGELIAEIYELRPVEILSDDAIFRQRWPTDTNRIAFTTTSVKAYINLEQRYADFTYNHNDGSVNNIFDLNNYEGNFEKLRWDMDPRTLEFMGPSPIQNPERPSYLRSRRRNQDNLTFYSGSAKLALGDYVLRASKVPYINIADSRIFPDSNRVTIRENAEMDDLFNAKIVADTANKYHRIEQVTIKIEGRLNVHGAGNYLYTDKNKKEQRFFLSEIYVEDGKYLGGKSNIPDSINFMVGPKLAFRGNALLHSFNKNLEYNGFFKPIHNLYLPRTDWFKSAAIINPDSLFIDLVPPLTNTLRQAIFNGIYVSNDSTHVYPAMFSRRRSTNDAELLKAEGTFMYHERLDEFRIGTREKIYDRPAQRGNMMTVNESKKQVYGEGRFNFGFETPKFHLRSAGHGLFNLKDTTFRMNLAMVLEFPFPPMALKLMFDSLNEQSASASNIYFDKRTLKIAIPELITEDKTLKKLSEDPSEDMGSRLLEELYKTIFISDLSFKWNQASRSFVNTESIGIRGFERYMLERRVEGKIEIIKRKGGDDLIIYLQQPGGSWYYFKYQRGTMFVLSSDFTFNEIIKITQDKMSSDEFKLRQASLSDRNKYVRNMKNR